MLRSSPVVSATTLFLLLFCTSFSFFLISLSLSLFPFSFLFSSYYPPLLLNDLPTFKSFFLNCQNSSSTLTNHCKNRPATLKVTSDFSLFNVISLSRSPEKLHIPKPNFEKSCPEFKKYLPNNFILHFLSPSLVPTEMFIYFYWYYALNFCV